MEAAVWLLKTIKFGLVTLDENGVKIYVNKKDRDKVLEELSRIAQQYDLELRIDKSTSNHLVASLSGQLLRNKFNITSLQVTICLT